MKVAVCIEVKVGNDCLEVANEAMSDALAALVDASAYQSDSKQPRDVEKDAAIVAIDRITKSKDIKVNVRMVD